LPTPQSRVLSFDWLRRIIMREDTCKLCLKTRELQDSHLYPRAFYKALINNDGGKRDPVHLTSTALIQKSGHITDYVLCHDCEQLFNRQGENWVNRHVFDGTRFRLRDILMASAPAEETEDDKLVPYAGAEIPSLDMEKLIYFGMSMFWRASVHKWTLFDGEVHIPLGEAEERLRRFLLGEGGLPADTLLNIMVSPYPEPWRSFFALGPQEGRVKPLRYMMMLAGFHLMLTVGSDHPGDRQWSTSHSEQKYIFTSSSFDLGNAYLTASTYLKQSGLDKEWSIHLKL